MREPLVLEAQCYNIYLFEAVTRSSGRLHSELTIDFADLAEWSQSSGWYFFHASLEAV